MVVTLIIVVVVLFALASGPLAGIWVYESVHRRYRNADKSHAFEHETAGIAKPITGSARKVDEVKGTADKRIKGENMGNHRARL